MRPALKLAAIGGGAVAILLAQAVVVTRATAGRAAAPEGHPPEVQVAPPALTADSTPAGSRARPPAAVWGRRTGLVPPAFQGAWSPDPNACGDPSNTDLLRIGRSAIRSGQDEARVTAAIQEGLWEVTLLTDAEGQAASRAYTFRLAPDRNTLVQRGEAQRVRRRCPPEGAAGTR